MTDNDKTDPYNGKLDDDDDADLGPSKDDDAADDIAAALPGDETVAKVEGSGPLP
jgi:hypothetical protein